MSRYYSPAPGSNSSNAVAGPSRLSYASPSMHVNHARSLSVDPNRMRRQSTAAFSRSSTPALYPYGAEFRSSSVVSATQRSDEEFRQKKRASAQRLLTTWEQLHEKYGHISLEDDDEIDIRTGRVVKDRGRLRAAEKREFGELSSGGEEAEETAAAYSQDQDFDSDEDELGGWDERSGLDPQIPNLLTMGVKERIWDTPDDLEDLREFHRMEAERARRLGEEAERLFTDEERSPSPGSDQYDEEDDHSDHLSQPSERLRGTRIAPVRLEDLFSSDRELQEGESSSEDELELIGTGNELDGEDSDVESTPESVSSHKQHLSPPNLLPLRRTRTVEVIIPTRARSVRRSSLPNPSTRSFPLPTTRPIHGNTAPISPISLNDLFTPPPEAVTTQMPIRPPSTASRRRHPSPTLSDRSSVGSSAQHHKAPNARDKDRDRILNELSEIHDASTAFASLPASLGASPYHDRLWKKRAGGVHQCKRCRLAGGTRAEKAPWCKGRRGTCLFEVANSSVPPERPVQDSGAEDEEEVQLPSRSTSRPANLAGDEADAIVYSRRQVVPEEQAAETLLRDSETPAPSSSTAKYRIRKCRLCKEAGGERAVNASTCQGRRTFKACVYERGNDGDETDGGVGGPSNRHDDGSDVEGSGSVRRRARSSTATRRRSNTARTGTADSDSDNQPIKRPERRRKGVQPIITSDSEDDLFRPNSRTGSPELTPFRAMTEEELPIEPYGLNPEYYLPGFSQGVNGRPRRCKNCRKASVIRAQRAWWCKGRSWAKFCPFVETDIDQTPCPEPEIGMEIPPQTLAEAMLSVSKDNRTDHQRRHAEVRERQRDIWSSVTAERYIPSPPPSSSADTPSPICAFNASFKTVRPPTSARSSSTMSSMPPSSPPVPFRSTIRDFRPPHPTPSPTVSVAPPVADRLTPSQAQISSPARMMASLPKRGATVGYHPTPPPSSASDSRSSSLIADNVTLSCPRKSALRRPSGSSAPSSTSGIKRARFSLPYRSPPPDFSSESVQAQEYATGDVDEESGDELTLGNDILDSSPYPLSSPAFAFPRYASSLSPLRTEWSVRAADVGFKLGPEHTGRVPSDMIRALAPSLSTARPTLGSSLYTASVQAFSSGRFTLPTPPLSSSSASSSGTRRQATSPISTTTSTGTGTTTGAISESKQVGSSGRASSSGPGLMLPPPVPAKRLSTPSQQASTSSTTPSTSTSTIVKNGRSHSSPLTTPTLTPEVVDDDPDSEPESEPVMIKFTSRPAAYLRAKAMSESRAGSRARSRSVSVSASVKAPGSDGMSSPSMRSTIKKSTSTSAIEQYTHNSAPAPAYTPTRTLTASSTTKMIPDQSQRPRGVRSTPTPTPLPIATPTRKRNRIERELARVARSLGDDAGLEWGLDEDTEDGGRSWREGSVVSRL